MLPIKTLIAYPAAAFRPLARLAAVLMVAAAVASCEDEEPATPPRPTPETTVKTVLMYFPWASDLTSFFYKNIADMGQAVASSAGDSVRVLVYMCTSATEAELYELVPQGSTCIHEPIKEYQDPAYTTAAGIASMLADVRAAAPAPRYAMTVGCHGMGWVPVARSRSRGLAQGFRYHWEAAGGPLTRFFGGTTPETQTDIATLAEGIEAAGMHMEFILFDDCYMSSVEAAYDLRHVADYIIGCPTEIMGYGMPYADIAPRLLGTPDYAEVCSEFLDFYTSYTWPYGTIGVTCTAELDSLARVVGKIEAAYDFDPALRPALQRMDGYSPPIFYDLGDYMAALCPDPALLQEFRSQLARTVPYSAHTPQYYSRFTGVEPIRTYSGITTSAPTVSQYAEAWTLTEWYADTH